MIANEAATSSSSTWVPAATALGGVLVGLFAPFGTSLLTAHREREARNDARREAATQRQNEFQQKTLIELQDLALDLVKTANALKAHCLAMQYATGNWSDNYPIKLTRRCENGSFALSRLGARVKDDDTRRSCKEMQKHFNHVFLATTQSSIDSEYGKFVFHFTRFVELSGERLRALEDDLLAR